MDISKSHVQIPQCLLGNFTHNVKEKYGTYENKIPYVYALNLDTFEYQEIKKRLFDAIPGYYSHDNEELLNNNVERPFSSLCKSKMKKPDFSIEELNENERQIIKTFMRYATTRSNRVSKELINNSFLREKGIKTHDDIITHSLREDDLAEYELTLVKNTTKKDFVVACNYTVPLVHKGNHYLFIPITPKIGIKAIKKLGNMKMEIISNEKDVFEINMATAKAESLNKSLIISQRLDELTDIASAYGKTITMKKEDA